MQLDNLFKDVVSVLVEKTVNPDTGAVCGCLGAGGGGGAAGRALQHRGNRGLAHGRACRGHAGCDGGCEAWRVLALDAPRLSPPRKAHACPPAPSQATPASPPAPISPHAQAALTPSTCWSAPCGTSTSTRTQSAAQSSRRWRWGAAFGCPGSQCSLGLAGCLQCPTAPSPRSATHTPASVPPDAHATRTQARLAHLLLVQALPLLKERISIERARMRLKLQVCRRAHRAGGHSSTGLPQLSLRRVGPGSGCAVGGGAHVTCSSAGCLGHRAPRREGARGRTAEAAAARLLQVPTQYRQQLLDELQSQAASIETRDEGLATCSYTVQVGAAWHAAMQPGSGQRCLQPGLQPAARSCRDVVARRVHLFAAQALPPPLPVTARALLLRGTCRWTPAASGPCTSLCRMPQTARGGWRCWRLRCRAAMPLPRISRPTPARHTRLQPRQRPLSRPPPAAVTACPHQQQQQQQQCPRRRIL